LLITGDLFGELMAVWERKKKNALLHPSGAPSFHAFDSRIVSVSIPSSPAQRRQYSHTAQ
jgi:hypothetical protein